MFVLFIRCPWKLSVKRYSVRGNCVLKSYLAKRLCLSVSCQIAGRAGIQ